MSRDLTFQDFCQLCCDADDLLHDLTKNNLTLQGKKPSGLKASMIWLLAQKRGIHITQHQLMMIYGSTELTIQRNVKLIEPLLKETVTI